MIKSYISVLFIGALTIPSVLAAYPVTINVHNVANMPTRGGAILNFSGDAADPEAGSIKILEDQQTSSKHVHASDHQDTIWEFYLFALRGQGACHFEGIRVSGFKTNHADHIDEINIEIRENPDGDARHRYECVVLSPWEHHEEH